MLLTPLGSLKSNFCGVARTTPPNETSPTMMRSSIFMLIWILHAVGGSMIFVPDQERRAKQHAGSQGGGAQKIHAGNEALFPYALFETGHRLNPRRHNARLRPAPDLPAPEPHGHTPQQKDCGGNTQNLFHYS